MALPAVWMPKLVPPMFAEGARSVEEPVPRDQESGTDSLGSFKGDSEVAGDGGGAFGNGRLTPASADGRGAIGDGPSPKRRSQRMLGFWANASAKVTARVGEPVL